MMLKIGVGTEMVMANGLVSTMKDFGHIISFVCAKQLLEPTRPVVTSLQGKFAEVYLDLNIRGNTRKG